MLISSPFANRVDSNVAAAKARGIVVCGTLLPLGRQGDDLGAFCHRPDARNLGPAHRHEKTKTREMKAGVPWQGDDD